MTKVFPQSQEEELEAVVSFFGEQYVSVDRSGELLAGRISIELEPSPKPVLLYMTVDKERRSFDTNQLSPVQLFFKLPTEYPAVEPELNVECIWIANDWIEKIRGDLSRVCSENIGFPMLFIVCQQVKDFVHDRQQEVNEICLDGNPYSNAHDIHGNALLDLALRICREYDEKVFAEHCHDCEVCFDNRPGSDCVKFLPCCHVFCKDCVKSYFETRLSAQAVSRLACLSDGCNSYPAESLIVELLGPEELERYQRIVLSNALAQMDNVALCPRVSCQNPGTISAVTANLATCLVCEFSFCTKCRRAYHGVDACRPTVVAVSRMIENEDGSMTFKKITVDEYLAANDDQRREMAWWYGGIDKLEAAMDEAMGRDRSQEWLDEYTRPCPSCGVAVFLSEGCNTVYCPCGTMFCYGCGEIFNDGKSNKLKHWTSVRRENIPCKRTH